MSISNHMIKVALSTTMQRVRLFTQRRQITGVVEDR